MNLAEQDLHTERAYRSQSPEARAIIRRIEEDALRTARREVGRRKRKLAIIRRVDQEQE